jgi:curved DNA-binding protein CbpA
VLTDAKKRRQYDQFGEDGLKGENFRSGSFNFDDFYKGFDFGGFGRGNGNKRGGNGFKFSSSFGGGFDDFFKGFDFNGFGRGNGNKRGGNAFKFSSFGGGFDDFFKMDDEDDYYEEEDSMFGGGFGDGFDDFGDFGDSFFGHHRNNHGDNMNTRQMYRESSSM